MAKNEKKESKEGSQGTLERNISEALEHCDRASERCLRISVNRISVNRINVKTKTAGKEKKDA
jgi:hypothetical protein